MKITVDLKTLKLKSPFQISSSTYEKVPLIYLTLSDNNYIGLGSSSPDFEVTGEDINTSFSILRNLKNEWFSIPIEEIDLYHNKIQNEFSNYPSVASAIEEALINLYCTKYNLTLDKYFKAKNSLQSLELNYTLGISTLNETLEEIYEKSSEGINIFKLKIGSNLNDDIKKIRTIFNKFPDIKLGVDCNAGYTMQQAEEFITAVNSINLTYIEQPVGNEWELLKELTKISQCPIIADESLTTIDDLKNIIENNHVNGVNLKMQKVGGPLNLINMYNFAKKNNLFTMIGCNFESNISITTATAIATVFEFDIVDLDSGSIDFEEDFIKGGAQTCDNKITFTGNIQLNV